MALVEITDGVRRPVREHDLLNRQGERVGLVESAVGGTVEVDGNPPALRLATGNGRLGAVPGGAGTSAAAVLQRAGDRIRDLQRPAMHPVTAVGQEEAEMGIAAVRHGPGIGPEVGDRGGLGRGVLRPHGEDQHQRGQQGTTEGSGGHRGSPGSFGYGARPHGRSHGVSANNYTMICPGEWVVAGPGRVVVCRFCGGPVGRLQAVLQEEAPWNVVAAVSGYRRTSTVTSHHSAYGGAFAARSSGVGQRGGPQWELDGKVAT